MSAETIYPTVVFKSHAGSVYTVCFDYLFTRYYTVMSVCSGLLLNVNLYTKEITGGRWLLAGGRTSYRINPHFLIMISHL